MECKKQFFLHSLWFLKKNRSAILPAAWFIVAATANDR
jgi:hypothetical protein